MNLKTMFGNNFTIAIRTLWKHKLFTLINILGLAIGISASLVIYLLVHYHFTFDKFEKDGERIYRVVSDFSFSGEIYHNQGVCDPMAAAVSRELTGLDAVTSIRTWNGDVKASIPVSGKSQPVVFKKQQDFVYADSNLFNMVGYQWLAGSSKTALNAPYQTVLTASRAEVYFPELNASQIIGKEIILDDSVRATISGVVQDITGNNTDFTFKAFVAYATLANTSLKPENWSRALLSFLSYSCSGWKTFLTAQK